MRFGPLERLLRPADWPLIVGLFAAAMLAAAHAFERFGGYDPCVLCLRQREVLWGVLAFAAAAFVVRLVQGASYRPRWPAIGLALMLLASAAGAFFHVGVESDWWAGPTECAATSSVSAGALTAALEGRTPIRPPACDTPSWFFLGITMAGWNTLLSLTMAALSLVVAFRSPRHGRRLG